MQQAQRRRFSELGAMNYQSQLLGPFALAMVRREEVRCSGFQRHRQMHQIHRPHADTYRTMVTAPRESKSRAALRNRSLPGIDPSWPRALRGASRDLVTTKDTESTKLRSRLQSRRVDILSARNRYRRGCRSIGLPRSIADRFQAIWGRLRRWVSSSFQASPGAITLALSA